VRDLVEVLRVIRGKVKNNTLVLLLSPLPRIGGILEKICCFRCKEMIFVCTFFPV
jgi:hypothetical protein